MIRYSQRRKSRYPTGLWDKMKNVGREVGGLGDRWNYSWEYGEDPSKNPAAYEDFKAGRNPDRQTQWEQNAYPASWENPKKGPIGWFKRTLWNISNQEALKEQKKREDIRKKEKERASDI